MGRSNYQNIRKTSKPCNKNTDIQHQILPPVEPNKDSRLMTIEDIQEKYQLTEEETARLRKMTGFDRTLHAENVAIATMLDLKKSK